MDFTRKARWVLDGHKAPDPIGSTYASVVLREIMRIALTYAALRRLDVKGTGVTAWAFDSSQYVKAVVKNVDKYLMKKEMTLPSKTETPAQTLYCPKLDVTTK
eukprot:4143705-Ditylum_brightwellii.AAC.1